MLVRNCAGGLVFWENKVYLLNKEGDQWIFPNGVIQKDELPAEAALRVVRETAGIIAEIVSAEGHLSCENSSRIHQNPIYNKTIWYVMISQNDKYQAKEEKGYKNGGYYSIQEAMELLTYNNKAILNFLSKKFFEIVEEISTEISTEYSTEHSAKFSTEISAEFSEDYNNSGINNNVNNGEGNKVKTYRNIELWGFQ